jgi:hypothetical protein
MLSKMFLIAVSFLAMICLGTAAPNPQYQKPQVSHPVLESAASNHCGTSSFTCTYRTPIFIPTPTLARPLKHITKANVPGP